MPSPILSLRLPCDPGSPRRARHAVGELPGLEDRREDLLLVVSELVSNAVLHCGSEEITVRVTREAGAVTVAVRDGGGSASVPHLRDDGALGQGGFGLVLVDRLSEQWGSHEDDGHVVWARLRTAPAESRARRAA